MTEQIRIPAFWIPGQTQLEFAEEIRLMLVRVQMKKAFIDGRITANQFLDFLDHQGYNVYDLAEDWGLEAA